MLFGEFQADRMKAVIHLARLKPDGPANSVRPLSPRLVGRLVNVAAATNERLVLTDEF